MKKLPILLSLGIVFSSVAASVGAPLLRYEFNRSGTVQESTGTNALSLSLLNYNNVATDYIGSAPVQRGGSSNDLALNFTADHVDAGLGPTDVAKAAAQATLNSTNAGFLREGLESFTISAWVLNAYAHDVVSADRRIFTLRNGAGQNIVDLRLVNPSGAANNTMVISFYGSEGNIQLTSATNTVPTNNDTWYFIAVTYDATTGDVVFYSGAEGGVLKTATLSNTSGGSVNDLLNNATSLGVGNVARNHQRRFDGYLSDVHFYGEALSAQDVGAIHAIPEPGSVALAGAVVLIACTRPWKRISR